MMAEGTHFSAIAASKSPVRVFPHGSKMSLWIISSTQHPEASSRQCE